MLCYAITLIVGIAIGLIVITMEDRSEKEFCKKIEGDK